MDTWTASALVDRWIRAKASLQLEPGGSGLGRDAHPQQLGGELLGRKQVTASEATLNACGVGVARSQGHSWAPNSSNGQQ